MAAPRTPSRAGRGALTKPAYWDRALAELSSADAVLARLIDAHPGLYLSRRSDAFTALARAIVGQQISVHAADAIWRRLVQRVASEQAAVAFPALDPQRVVALPSDALRACGFSARKAEYLTDLAAHFVSGRLEPSAWRSLDDEALIEALTDVKGIGRWTAEMFLIFHELRPDVFPVDDIGLQKAIALHYHRGRRVVPTTLQRHGKRWRPWRSVATWYLWRSLDPVPVEY
jgi:DNA-3-methyladenine glycosylase II